MIKPRSLPKYPSGDWQLLSRSRSRIRRTGLVHIFIKHTDNKITVIKIIKMLWLLTIVRMHGYGDYSSVRLAIPGEEIMKGMVKSFFVHYRIVVRQHCCTVDCFSKVS